MLRTLSSAPQTLAPVVPILIDGQNLFHSLNRFQIKEQDINWEKFAQYLVGEEYRAEIFWFRAGEVREIPLTKTRILKLLIDQKYPSRVRELMTLFRNRQLPSDIYLEMMRLFRERKRWLQEQQENFFKIDRMYEQLAQRYNHVHICHKGIVRFDPYQQKCLGEKGVDVAISVKMCRLAYLSSCSKMILMSGDMDFIDAVREVQENGKEVHVIRFGDKNRQSNILAHDLAEQVDQVIPIPGNALKKRFAVRKGDRGIVPMPAGRLRKIRQRLPLAS